MSDQQGGTEGLDDLAQHVGADVSGLVRQEVGTAKEELGRTVEQGATGAGLIGGGAVAGFMALLFGSVAVWRGLGNRIGYGWSAALLAGAYGGTAALLSAGGGATLKDLRGAPRSARAAREAASSAEDAAA